MNTTVPIKQGRIPLNARDAIQLLNDLEPATLGKRCPWCGGPLDGAVMASFLDGKLVSVCQDKRIGARFYVWFHRKEGCRVPALDRIQPKASV